ncbi:MAG: indolepyruvate ferredoxin oxidoreductase subunit alpha [Candidatus Auribacterota bacterium]|jgi:indolepyruvate ferredoxin oxidoreductase alpha subunit|nr:indolepyruvate ferredoxin oxidoreductase subunit alpha [Candidatus Auribacterota bacterium]
MTEQSSRQKVFLSGNEAVARGAYEAGVAVGTAYPGTPSSEISPALAMYPGVNVEWSVNEKVALEVACGACFCGARTLVAMKHVGVNVASDPLLTLSLIGVRGGLVLISADDPGMHSSQNEQDNRIYARFAKIPMLEPSDSQESKDFTKLAFTLSEQFDTPVMVRMTTRVCHAKTIVEIEEPEKIEREYSFEKDTQKFVMIPAYARKRHVIVEARLKKLENFSEDTTLNRIEQGADNSLGIICSGIVYQYVKEMFPSASVLKLGFSYPLCKNKIRSFCQSHKKVYVIEELEPLLYNDIKAMGLNVKGKTDKLVTGELTPNRVREIITGESSDIVPSAPGRPPVMCAGCIHRGAFVTLKKLKMIVTGDIGCYTLGTLPPLSALDTCVCMGASIGAMLGMTKVLSKEQRNKVVAVIGDSTFFHSGITGLIDVVYNKGAGTVMILDNRTTAMTGQQDHPGTGMTIMSEPTESILPEKIAEAVGVKMIKVIDPYDIPAIEDALRESMNTDEVSLIVLRRVCVLKDKTVKRLVAQVEPSLCVQCKQCLTIGCPAISSDMPPKIDMHLCNGCGLCVHVCKVGAITCKER